MIARKCQNQAEAKRDGEINPQNYNFSAGKKRLASQFNFTYRYIDDVYSINNQDFENYLGQMYPPELEIKDTTESNTLASYLDLLLSIGRDGQLHTPLRQTWRFQFPYYKLSVPE